ncbi:hypothetical protein [Dyella acidiphila]|uniref:Uncharacterized protein n=1 Tax=Dyella acidiphila TaxID=2775866 RepID=A0ABR9G779_9GAMM|nr:hypothetical protein [Dyella acidiphila]MBE1159902.1 hypothetical protein [Dyella acidiphila]
MLAIGAFGLFISIGVPLLQHKPPTLLCFPIAAFSLPFFALSFPYIAFGMRAVRHFGEPQNIRDWRPKYWIPLSLLGMLAALWIDHHYDT